MVLKRPKLIQSLVPSTVTQVTRPQSQPSGTAKGLPNPNKKDFPPPFPFFQPRKMTLPVPLKQNKWYRSVIDR